MQRKRSSTFLTIVIQFYQISTGEEYVKNDAWYDEFKKKGRRKDSTQQY